MHTCTQRYTNAHTDIWPAVFLCTYVGRVVSLYIRVKDYSLNHARTHTHTLPQTQMQNYLSFLGVCMCVCLSLYLFVCVCEQISIIYVEKSLKISKEIKRNVFPHENLNRHCFAPRQTPQSLHHVTM